MTLKEFIETQLDHSEVRDFALFAFGKDYETLQGDEFREAWNKQHGSIIKLDPNGKPKDDIQKMIKLWKWWKRILIKT
jgi:hypothetical protein